MKKIFFALFLLSWSSPIFAQADLSATLESLKSQLTEVETKSSTFSQVLEWDKALPYKLKLTVEETGKKKGKVKVTSYEFSLKDVDPNAIRSKTNKDIVEVNIFMKSKQKLAIFSQEGEFKSYVAKLKFFAGDADSGKAMEKALKDAVKKAKEIPSSCPSSAQEGYQWLMANIGDFSVGDVAKEQSFEIKELMADYSLVTKGKKDKVERWVFNLADLNKRSVKLQIKSKEFYVEAKTKRNLKFIAYKKEEGKSSFVNKLKFYISDFDKAKCLLNVLEMAIEDSEKKVKANQPKFASANAALAKLGELTAGVEVDKYKITQDLKPSCATTLTTSETKGSSDAKEKEWKFNFLDISPKNIDIKIKGSLVLLELGTAKNKLIQAYKDGELGSYTKKLTLVAADIESAKIMKVAAMEAAKQCQSEVGFKGHSSASENLDMIVKSLKDYTIPETEQSLELIDGEQCKWKFTSIKSGKKQLEEVYEFNLEDLDEKKIKWNISGKKLSVQVNSKYKEKNIKYYKNGEPGNYKNAFSIEFNDIEAARNTIIAIKKAVELCKE